MKKLNFMIFSAFMVIFLLSANVCLFAQGNNFKLDGNNNGNANSKLGFTNSTDLKLITRDSVRQTITSDGNIIFEKKLTVKEKIITDSMNIGRILPPMGDSIIHFGPHSISTNVNANRVSWTPTFNFTQCPGGGPLLFGLISGLTIANGNSVAIAPNSMSLGNNVVVGCGATNSFAVGRGVTNLVANSFQLGFGGTTMFVDASGVGINLSTHIAASALDVNGHANIRNVDQDLTNTLNQVLVRDPNNYGLIQWRDASTLIPVSSTAWVVTGNNPTFPDNIFGTMNNEDIRIFTNLQQRGIFTADGLFGIGTNLPQGILDVRGGTSATGNGTDINIYAQNGMTVGNTNGGSIFLMPGAANGTGSLGFVGIAQPNPLCMLDVNGDINMSTPTNGYYINKMEVLKYHDVIGSGTASISNIFVGVGAGSNNTFILGPPPPIGLGAGYNNTFVGNKAGNNNTTGLNNTFIGFEAGVNHVAGLYNTVVGTEAGHSLKCRYYNTFIGYKSGYMAGNALGQGEYGNTFVGYESGLNTKLTKGNAFFGNQAGLNNEDGNDNTYLGSFADGTVTPALNNSAAIGANAYVTASNSMVLGSINGVNAATTDTKVGIGTTAPANRLEIATTVFPGINYGLRLSALPGYVPSTSTNTALTVDANGDVILSNVLGFGAGCSGYPSTFYNLSDNWRVGFHDYNLFFDGQGASNTNSIGIGYNCNTILPAKLSVFNKINGIAGTDAISIDAEIGTVPYSGIGTNIAGKFSVNGNGIFPSNYGALYDVAGYFTTKSTLTGPASGPYFDKDWAIFVPKDGGKVQFGGSLPDNPPFLFSVYGSSANLSATWLVLSDAQLKTNISSYNDGLNIIRNINPVNFEYNGLAGLPVGKKHIGIIAQQLAPIAPYMIDTVQMVLDTNTNIESSVLVLNSDAFAYMSINAIKKLDSNTVFLLNRVDSLTNALSTINNQYNDLQSLITQCCNNGGNAKIISTINVELANNAVLYQNIPNPFGEETTINYYIPDNTSNAKIIFFDMYGQSLKDVPLTETGSGNIHVDSKNLASGIYSYSLVIDGKVIDTKKMVRNK